MDEKIIQLLQRIAVLETKLEQNQKDVKEIEKQVNSKLEEIDTKLDSINTFLHQVNGGWKTLAIIGGILIAFVTMGSHVVKMFSDFFTK